MQIKILFVCLGNICRSPLAEAIFRKKVKEEGISDEKILVDSAGTSAYHIGELADSRSIQNAKKNEVDIVHRARQVLKQDIELFDYVLAMDRKNYEDILKLVPPGSNDGKIFLMRNFAHDAFDPKSERADVPDPFFGGDEGFENVFHLLDSCCDSFLTYLMKRHPELNDDRK